MFGYDQDKNKELYYEEEYQKLKKMDAENQADWVLQKTPEDLIGLLRFIEKKDSSEKYEVGELIALLCYGLHPMVLRQDSFFQCQLRSYIKMPTIIILTRLKLLKKQFFLSSCNENEEEPIYKYFQLLIQTYLILNDKLQGLASKLYDNWIYKEESLTDLKLKQHKNWKNVLAPGIGTQEKMSIYSIYSLPTQDSIFSLVFKRFAFDSSIFTYFFNNLTDEIVSDLLTSSNNSEECRLLLNRIEKQINNKNYASLKDFFIKLSDETKAQLVLKISESDWIKLVNATVNDKEAEKALKTVQVLLCYSVEDDTLAKYFKVYLQQKVDKPKISLKTHFELLLKKFNLKSESKEEITFFDYFQLLMKAYASAKKIIYEDKKGGINLYGDWVYNEEIYKQLALDMNGNWEWALKPFEKDFLPKDYAEETSLFSFVFYFFAIESKLSKYFFNNLTSEIVGQILEANKGKNKSALLGDLKRRIEGGMYSSLLDFLGKLDEKVKKKLFLEIPLDSLNNIKVYFNKKIEGGNFSDETCYQLLFTFLVSEKIASGLEKTKFFKQLKKEQFKSILMGHKEEEKTKLVLAIEKLFQEKQYQTLNDFLVNLDDELKEQVVLAIDEKYWLEFLKAKDDETIINQLAILLFYRLPDNDVKTYWEKHFKKALEETKITFSQAAHFELLLKKFNLTSTSEFKSHNYFQLLLKAYFSVEIVGIDDANPYAIWLYKLALEQKENWDAPLKSFEKDFLPKDATINDSLFSFVILSKKFTETSELFKAFIQSLTLEVIKKIVDSKNKQNKEALLFLIKQKKLSEELSTVAQFLLGNEKKSFEDYKTIFLSFSEESKKVVFEHCCRSKVTLTAQEIIDLVNLVDADKWVKWFIYAAKDSAFLACIKQALYFSQESDFCLKHGIVYDPFSPIAAHFRSAQEAMEPSIIFARVKPENVNGLYSEFGDNKSLVLVEWVLQAIVKETNKKEKEKNRGYLQALLKNKEFVSDFLYQMSLRQEDDVFFLLVPIMLEVRMYEDLSLLLSELYLSDETKAQLVLAIGTKTWLELLEKKNKQKAVEDIIKYFAILLCYRLPDKEVKKHLQAYIKGEIKIPAISAETHYKLLLKKANAEEMMVFSNDAYFQLLVEAYVSAKEAEVESHIIPWIESSYQNCLQLEQPVKWQVLWKAFSFKFFITSQDKAGTLFSIIVKNFGANSSIFLYLLQNMTVDIIESMVGSENEEIQKALTLIIEDKGKSLKQSIWLSIALKHKLKDDKIWVFNASLQELKLDWVELFSEILQFKTMPINGIYSEKETIVFKELLPNHLTSVEELWKLLSKAYGLKESNDETKLVLCLQALANRLKEQPNNKFTKELRDYVFDKFIKGIDFNEYTQISKLYGGHSLFSLLVEQEKKTAFDAVQAMGEHISSLKLTVKLCKTILESDSEENKKALIWYLSKHHEILFVEAIIKLAKSVDNKHWVNIIELMKNETETPELIENIKQALFFILPEKVTEEKKINCGSKSTIFHYLQQHPEVLFSLLLQRNNSEKPYSPKNLVELFEQTFANKVAQKNLRTTFFTEKCAFYHSFLNDEGNWNNKELLYFEALYTVANLIEKTEFKVNYSSQQFPTKLTAIFKFICPYYESKIFMTDNLGKANESGIYMLKEEDGLYKVYFIEVGNKKSKNSSWFTSKEESIFMEKKEIRFANSEIFELLKKKAEEGSEITKKEEKLLLCYFLPSLLFKEDGEVEKTYQEKVEKIVEILIDVKEGNKSFMRNKETQNAYLDIKKVCESVIEQCKNINEDSDNNIEYKNGPPLAETLF